VYRPRPQTTAQRTDLCQLNDDDAPAHPFLDTAANDRDVGPSTMCCPAGGWTRNAMRVKAVSPTKTALITQRLTPAFGGNVDVREPKRRVVASDGRRRHMEERDRRAD
jgi:hypothetical protein